MGAIRSAIADGVLTFMWVFSVSTLRVLTSLIAGFLGLQQAQGVANLFIITLLIFTLLFFIGTIGHALGGASFNPTATAALYAAGVGGPNFSLFSAALRFPAQAVGAASGAWAIMEVMPNQYKHMLGGPSLKVDAHTGAVAEGLLTFTITFLVLLIVLRGPKSPFVKNWLISMSTVALVVTGGGFTGPSMNPANAFGWAYMNNKHNAWEHFYVYWICPFTGAILAAWIFRAVFPPPLKQKKQ